MTNSVKNRRFLDTPSAVATLLCVVGLLVSAYLSYESLFSSETRACLTGADCDVVRESRYSSIAGIPVSLLGVAGVPAADSVNLGSHRKKKRNGDCFSLSAWRLFLFPHTSHILRSS